MRGWLHFAGYNKLRRGRIHLYCPTCRRKQSNAPRAVSPPFDPPMAVLAHVVCERCSAGCKVEGVSAFLDGRGRTLCDLCGKVECDPDGCDEGLLGSGRLT